MQNEKTEMENKYWTPSPYKGENNNFANGVEYHPNKNHLKNLLSEIKTNHNAKIILNKTKMQVAK